MVTRNKKKKKSKLYFCTSLILHCVFFRDKWFTACPILFSIYPKPSTAHCLKLQPYEAANTYRFTSQKGGGKIRKELRKNYRENERDGSRSITYLWASGRGKKQISGKSEPEITLKLLECKILREKRLKGLFSFIFCFLYLASGWFLFFAASTLLLCNIFLIESGHFRLYEFFSYHPFGLFKRYDDFFYIMFLKLCEG